jgi:hypothetical protein
MKLEAKNPRLRIAVRNADEQDTWILEGRLAGQIVDELTASWERAVSEQPERKRVVDLVGVTFIDERGEQALLEMMVGGARFVVRGVYTKSLLESLKQSCTREA